MNAGRVGLPRYLCTKVPMHVGMNAGGVYFDSRGVCCPVLFTCGFAGGDSVNAN